MNDRLNNYKMKDINEVAYDYLSLLTVFNMHNPFALQNKLDAIEKKYAIELMAYNLFRPSMTPNFEDKINNTMHFLQVVMEGITFIQLYTGQ